MAEQPPRDYVQYRQDVLDRVRRLLIDQLQLRIEPEEIDPDAPLFGTGLALDSIDAVDLVVAMETMFDVELDDVSESIVHLRTVNTLVDLVLEFAEVRAA